MKKKRAALITVVIVIVAIEILVLAGGFIANNAGDINRSYRAIRSAYVFNHIPLNNFLYAKDEITFIYDAINNKISKYPKNVPNFINLPIDSIIDAIGADERFHIDYTNDDNYENGVIIAQEPKADEFWDDGVVVTLTVNRKYSDIKSIWGYMSQSSGSLYWLSNTDTGIWGGAIWKDGTKIADDEITRIYVNNGNVYYSDNNAVYQLTAEGVLQEVLGKQTRRYYVINEKIYYIDDDQDLRLYCYNMNDKTTSLVFDEPIMFFYINSDYIVCNIIHDVFILDTESYTVIKELHSEDTYVGCSLDNDNVYVLETEFTDDITKSRSRITKYDLKNDEQTEIFNSFEWVSGLLAIDDKIIFIHYTADYQMEFQYINTITMENKFFSSAIDIFGPDVGDILFDGQKIIYKQDDAFYSICIFTGKTKKIG